MSRTACVFCLKTPKKWSNEHVFPQWLLRYLGKEDTHTSFVHQELFDDSGNRLRIDLNDRDAWRKREVVSKRSHTFKQMVLGSVCEKCNGGWMSKLEVATMPLLISLIEHRRTIAELTDAERFVVAKWATKTAYTYSMSANFERWVPAQHLHELYRTRRMPKGTVVFAAQTPREDDLGSRQSRHWITQLREAKDQAEYLQLESSSYKISFAIAGLILLVAYWPPNERWLLTCNPEISLPIWNWQRPLRFTATLDGSVPLATSMSEHAIRVNFDIGISKAGVQQSGSESAEIAIRERQASIYRDLFAKNTICFCGSGLKFRRCHGASM